MFRSSNVIVVAPLAFLLVMAQAVGGQRPARTPDLTPQMSLMGFALGRSTLTDIQGKLGATTAGGCSTEEEASKMICYVSSGPDKTRVIFESGFSGGWSVLDGLRVVSGSLTPDCRLQCLRTSAFDNGIKTSGGLRLGLTRQQLIALLGPPTKETRNRLTFKRQWKRPMTKAEIDKETQTFKTPVTEPYFDVLDNIEVTFTGATVSEFEIKRTTTY
jgi:hypothetical protein